MDNGRQDGHVGRGWLVGHAGSSLLALGAAALKDVRTIGAVLGAARGAAQDIDVLTVASAKKPGRADEDLAVAVPIA